MFGLCFWFVWLPILLGLLYLFVKLDCNFVLLLCEYFGKQPTCLHGKVVWITGASSGIGRHLAYELARAGCKLIVTGTRKERLEETRNNCLKLNGRLGVNDVLVLPLVT